MSVSACGAGHKAIVGKAIASTSAPSPTPSATVTPTPSPTPTLAAVNPLTGVAPVPTGPVIAVKIDDTSNGRPQRGVDLADIVYIEQAEGGLSRLVAVFATNKPVVEAVRSVRASDPELLAQYGPITLVASGGGGDALPTLYSSPLHAVIDDRGDKGFSRDSSRGQPYNLTSNLATVSADVPGAGVQSIGFQWAAAATPVAGASAATNVQTKVGSTTVNFVWDAPTARYVRVINGVRQHALDGSLVSTPNVIVQFCTVTANPNDVDVNGAVSQYTHSIGSGQVVVFSNDQRIDGTWSRPAAASGTTLTATSGAPIALTPGGAWVALVATGAPITSS
jgi:hypothetical protein